MVFVTRLSSSWDMVLGLFWVRSAGVIFQLLHEQRPGRKEKREGKEIRSGPRKMGKCVE